MTADTLTDEQMARIAEAHGWLQVKGKSGQYRDYVHLHDEEGDVLLIEEGRLTDAGAFSVMKRSRLDVDVVDETCWMVGLADMETQVWRRLVTHEDLRHAIALAELVRLDAAS